MKKDIFQAGLTAAIGAGIVTSWCVGHGQDPIIALGITVMAGLFAALCYQADII